MLVDVFGDLGGKAGVLEWYHPAVVACLKFMRSYDKEATQLDGGKRQVDCTPPKQALLRTWPVEVTTATTRWLDGHGPQ